MRLLMLLIALVLSACGLLDGDFLETNMETVQQVEDFIGQPLPPSSTDIHYQVQGFTDIFIRLRFTAPAPDAQAFLNGLGLTDLSVRAEAADFFPAGAPGWWQPIPTAAPLVGELDRRDANRFYEVVVDQTARDAWTVYLVVFST
jgi:hypothetical protein